MVNQCWSNTNQSNVGGFGSGEREWQNAAWEEFSGFQAAMQNPVSLQRTDSSFFIIIIQGYGVA